MEKLKELLLKKDELYNNTELDDEEYYYLVEQIDNEIANNYTFDEIEKAEREIRKEN